MKALSMAISSPEMLRKQLSRNHVGSRSKSSSPIFYTRHHSHSAAAGITAAQEPYSPKVTCIGQVRSRKSGGAAVSLRRRCRCWFMKAKFLSRRRRAFWRSFCKWVVFFKAGYCRRVDEDEGCFGAGKKIEFLSENKNGDENDSINVEIRKKDSCCSPPKNALMLMRSAPYRASSLGERIWREKIEESSSELRSGNEVAEGIANRTRKRRGFGESEEY